MANNKLGKVFLTSFIALLAGVVLLAPRVSYAWDWASFVGGLALGGIGKAVAWILASIIIPILAAILSFISGLVDLGLNLGNRVTTLEAVITGWNVVLSVTNLGFVLAIIVIAFATIFRVEGYEIRRTLMKLIVAALLVNFSMVIAGAFLSVSNVFTNYLQSAAFSNQSISAILGGAFQPQKLVDGPLLENISKIGDGANVIANALISLVFTIAAFFVIILTIATLALMLLYRFFWLAFLLILSPIVWLMMVFPGTQKYWRDWWGEFIRWTFFAPIVLFFVYLAAATAVVLRGGQGGGTAGTTAGGVNEIIAGTVGSESVQAIARGGAAVLPQHFFTNILNSIILIGLLIGGIFVANKLGISGGNIGVQLGGRLGGYAGRMAGYWGKRAVTRPIRGPKAEEGLKKMQKAGITRGGLLGAAQARIGTLGLVAGARSKESILRQSAERIKGMSDDEIVARFPIMSAVDKAAAIQKLKGKEEKFTSESVEALLGQTKSSEQLKDMFKRYGADKGIEALMQRKGMTPEIVQLRNAMESATGDEREQISMKINGHLRKLFASMTPKDLASAAAKGKWFTQKDDQLASSRLEVMAGANPGAVGNALAGMKGEDFDKFINVLKKTRHIPEKITVEVNTRGQSIEPMEISKDAASLAQIQHYADKRGQGEAEKKQKGLFNALSRGLTRRLMFAGEEIIREDSAEGGGGEEKKT